MNDTAPDTLTELNDEPVYRANRELAADLSAAMTLSALLDVSTRKGTFFVATVDPDAAFVRWGRYWNVITCRVHSDTGWMVCGRYVVIPEAAE